MAQPNSTRKPARKQIQGTRLKSSIPLDLNHGKLSDEIAPRKKSDYWIAALATIAIIALGEWTLGGQFGLRNTTTVNEGFSPTFRLPKQETVSSTGLLDMLANELNKQWPEDNAGQATDDLLLRASEAVANEEHHQFADTMRLLGVNALRELDIDSATVYLDEALDVFEELEDDMGIASVELLRGEVNLKRRSQARRAAYAYDAMQLARWKSAHGYFHDAVDELNLVVSENLALNRYGAAAAAYQTLYKGFSAHGQQYEAQQAGVEIVKLHASSGRPLRAQAMLQSLETEGLDAQTVQQLKQTSVALQREYEESVTQMARARDFQQLYNHFINAGDPVRAWQFRLKSQQSMRGVTQRAMHRQQTGVLALLYTSNDHMKNAQKSLDRAGQIFSDYDRPELVDVSAKMRRQVY